MRDLRIEFHKVPLRDCETPYDHSFYTRLLGVAGCHKIPYSLLNGNMATKFMLLACLGHNALDLRYIKTIYARFATCGAPKYYPTVSFPSYYFYYPVLKSIRQLSLLDYPDYDKCQAIEELRERCGWKDYGGKHHEAVSTRFFQRHYLPIKFGIDKPKAHLSSLIVAGQRDREEAPKGLIKPPCSEAQINDDKRHMSDNLGISLAGWEAILYDSPRDDSEFASGGVLHSFKATVVRLLGL